MKASNVFAPVAATLGILCASTTLSQGPDHLKCYRIGDTLRLSGTADLPSPQFGPDAGCKISKARLFCVPAEKTNVSVVDRSTASPIVLQAVTGPNPGDRVCYKMKCPAPVPDQLVSDQFGTRTVRRLRSALLCTPAVKGGVPSRFVDNGDGTVTDSETGLEWEKKTNDGGVHDADNAYDWSQSGGPPDGSAFTDFLDELNACTSPDGTAVVGGFAGHCDWRLPTVAELRTIVDTGAPNCGFGPMCIDAIFGAAPAPGSPSHSGFPYWSSTHTADPPLAWRVRFVDGGSEIFLKHQFAHVRAVRGGP